MEAQSEYAHITYVHAFTPLAPICILSRCLLAKFLHPSSVESFVKSALLVGSPSSVLSVGTRRRGRLLLAS